ncbi:hypothetical protein GGS20DRAFT_568009, partial [Poronia punctata]
MSVCLVSCDEVHKDIIRTTYKHVIIGLVGTMLPSPAPHYMQGGKNSHMSKYLGRFTRTYQLSLVPVQSIILSIFNFHVLLKPRTRLGIFCQGEICDQISMG